MHNSRVNCTEPGLAVRGPMCRCERRHAPIAATLGLCPFRCREPPGTRRAGGERSAGEPLNDLPVLFRPTPGGMAFPKPFTSPRRSAPSINVNAEIPINGSSLFRRVDPCAKNRPHNRGRRRVTQSPDPRATLRAAARGIDAPTSSQ